jgi:hypothetical protein
LARYSPARRTSELPGITSGENFQNLLWFDGCDLTFPDLFSATLTALRAGFDNCIITAPAASGYGLVFSDCGIENCKLVQDTSCNIDVQYHGFTTAALFKNNHILRSTTTGSTTFTLKGLYGYSITPVNCLFERYSGSCEIDVYDAGYLTNCAFIGGNFTIKCGIAVPSVIYEKRTYGNAARITGNAIIVPIGMRQTSFLFGVPALDFDLIDFENFVELTADLKIEFVPEETFYGTGTQNYYTIEFIEADVPEEIKQGFGDNRIWVVEREDFESDLAGRTIYNLALYAAGGHTIAIDFDSDEGFLDPRGNVGNKEYSSGTIGIMAYDRFRRLAGNGLHVLKCFHSGNPRPHGLAECFRRFFENKD